MLSSLKSDFLKIFTIRSTYILSGISFLLIILMSFYFEGYRGVTGTAASELTETALKELVGNTAGMVAIFVSLVGILLMAHEYRYNTIMYTLTYNTSRTKMLISKSIAIIVFSVCLGILTALFSIACYYVGLSLRDAALPTQDFNTFAIFSKTALYFTIYGLLGLLLAVIVKSVVGAIAFFFIAPVTVEPLLGIPLKENAVYLPITMFDSIMGAGILQSNLSPTRIITLSIFYIVILWFVALAIFLRRDAS